MHASTFLVGIAVAAGLTNAAKAGPPSGSSISALKPTGTVACSPKNISALVSTFNQPFSSLYAYPYCSSVLPGKQFGETILPQQVVTTIVTSTVIFCAPFTATTTSSSKSVSKSTSKSASKSSASQAPSNAPSSLIKTTAKHTTSATQKATPPCTTPAKPTGNHRRDDPNGGYSAYSILTGLKPKCQSSVCSKLAGITTVTPAARTTTKFVTTTASKIQSCSAYEYCDTRAKNGPVCRPAPGVNDCDVSKDVFQGDGNILLSPCTSTNGCPGECWYPPFNASQDPTVKPVGVCAVDDADRFDIFANGGGFISDGEYNIYPCSTDQDCGRGKVCAYTGFTRNICLKAASEVCVNSGVFPNRLRRDSEMSGLKE